MPIKFRCSYCRQFLGISRNRVGGIVDCPTCGRSIRVPGLDGVAAPLPSPELDRDDAHLARALDELAALADAPLIRPVMAEEEDVNEEAEIPQPLPEPEPVELPMPVRMAPVAVIDPVANGSTEAATVAESRAALEELLQPVSIPHEPELPRLRTEPAPSTHWLLFVVLIPISTLLLGLVIGWCGRGQAVSTQQPAVPENKPVEKVAVEPSGGLEGRITYQTADGETRPDAGAIVLAIPETWAGQLRLSPVGLRPGDAEADQSAALKMAIGFGGGAVRTDEAGRYQLPLPQAGRYTVITISRFAEQSANAPLAPDDLTRLQNFLADPLATLGKRAAHVDTVTTTTERITPADHAF